MPRDYKNRANTPAGRQRRAPGWLLFTSGLLLGLFVSALACLKWAPMDREASLRLRGPVAQPERAPVEVEEPDEGENPRPRFDFYTILPEMEVVVPEAKPEPPPASTASTVAAGQGGAVQYMLQMGSFRKFVDADRLKASLALVGIEAEIQKVRVNGGDIFHRVRSGPYTEQRADALRSRLIQNNINSLKIRLK